jgi:rhamnose utilization protein RhaD (predicted bifunctional aldolase and dehydrogenase)
MKSREIFGDKVLYLPYADPGLILFKITEQKIREYNLKFQHDPQVVLIQNHGIFVAANSTDEIKGIYAGIEAKLKSSFEVFPVLKRCSYRKTCEVLPALRMLLSENNLKVVTAFNSSWIKYFILDRQAFENGIARPFNPDQMVYCLPEYLFIESTGTQDDIITEARAKMEEFRHEGV